MLKQASRIFFLVVLPGWILATFLVLISFSWFKPLYSAASSGLYSLFAEPVETGLRYQVIAAPNSKGLLVAWPQQVPRELSAYQSAITAFDGVPSPLAEWLQVSAVDGPLAQSPGTGLWRPSTNSYKQLVYRTAKTTYLDQILERGATDAQVTLAAVSSGMFNAPLDPFGGIFLFSQSAPPAVRVDANELFDIRVSGYDSLGRSFLQEVWALNNQQWAYAHWSTFLLAATMTLLPWVWFAYLRKLLPAVLGLVASSALIWVVLFVQMNWTYPFVLPLLSPLLAWIWFADLTRLRGQIGDLQQRCHDGTRLWIDHLLDENKPAAAFRYLKEQPQQGKLYTDIWHLVAQGFERNRNFSKSIECYQQIIEVDATNAYAKQQLKQLSEVVDGSKTVAIAQGGGELPVGKIANLILGRYEISGELGRGAMGIVYSAEDPKINRQVALKVVNLKNLGVDEVDQVKQRFFREAQAAGKLNHPNIVTVYDVGEEHDVAYIAMDLLQGKPLSEMIADQSFALTTIITWMAEAAEALGYAHENQIIHRDVKPANMIIEERSNRLQLTDFGVARIAGVQQTQTGIVLGSPSYMSPEQIRGEKLTGATDIFSLGVTLYQCITGALPFSGETLPALAYAITQAKQESPRSLNSAVPVSLVRIVNKALQKEPESRFATAYDLAKSLRSWVSDRTSANA